MRTMPASARQAESTLAWPDIARALRRHLGARWSGSICCIAVAAPPWLVVLVVVPVGWTAFVSVCASSSSLLKSTSAHNPTMFTELVVVDGIASLCSEGPRCGRQVMSQRQ